MPRGAFEAIYDLAADQLGYFTTAQAREAGIATMAAVMMARRGVLERVSRGVYRLVRYPLGPLSQYVEASLWPVEVRGVVSHESALELYGISDVSPAQTHVTVPTSFRTRRKLPAHLALHHADLNPEDWHLVDGIPVTTPSRSIRDCHAAHLGDALVRQAVEEAQRGGVITRREADLLTTELLTATRRQ